jgi:hypothetical protein
VATGCENRNNIYVGNDFPFGIDPEPGVTWSHNFYFDNTSKVPVWDTVGRVNGTRSPFVNAPADFHLLANAEAIDRGAALSSIYAFDYDGNSRPQGSGWDIGAYEHLGGTPSDITPPLAPTGIAVQ